MKSALTMLFIMTLLWQSEPEGAHYSTCPKDMAKLNTGYVLVDPADYARVTVQPRIPESSQREGEVRVQIYVRRDRAFCATALDGNPPLQEAAVKVAMEWRFTKKRPPFRGNIYGVLTLRTKQ
jgi:hypothetical protein